jgi:hypothetical protein
VLADGLLRVERAAGHEAAAALDADHQLEGGEDDAVKPDQVDDNRLHEPLSMAKFPEKATCYRRNPGTRGLTGLGAHDPAR